MEQKFFGPFFQTRTAVFLAVLSSSAQAAEVTGAWARATAPHQDTAAIYLVVHSDKPTKLIGAETPAADMAMLHRTARSGGMSDMQDVEAVDIPAHGTAAFSPGGMHIMLMGLKHGLVAGDSVDLMLSFADGERLRLAVPVQPIRAAGPPGVR